MANLKQKVNQALNSLMEVQDQMVPSSKVALPGPARSYISNNANFDDNAAFDPTTVGINTTFRHRWRTPDAAIQQNKVITTNMPMAVTVKGAAAAPVMTSATLGAVPDMSVAVRVPASSQVQITWQFSGSLSTATAQATFVLYRDNVKIGSPLYGGSAVNNGKFSVNNTYIDAPSAGLHSYSVYWATNAGTLTADAKSRAITGLVLKPQ